MKSPDDTASVWKQAVSESLWGKRGLVKSANLWLPLAVIVSVEMPEPDLRATAGCFLIFAAVACWSLASILGNDLADQQDDSAAGKQRWISRLPYAGGICVVTLLVVLGGLVVMLGGGKLSSLGVYAAAVAAGLLYSIRPAARFKDRGCLGPLVYSLSGACAFALLPWTWFASGWRLPLVLTPTVLLDKWVNLHFHQVVDYEADVKCGATTYAVAAGVKRARATLQWAAILASAWLLATFIFVLLKLAEWRPVILVVVLAVVLAIGIYVSVVRKRPEKVSALLRELPWPYLGLSYAMFRILPLILFVKLALQEPTMWLVVGTFVILLSIESWYSAKYRYE